MDRLLEVIYGTQRLPFAIILYPLDPIHITNAFCWFPIKDLRIECARECGLPTLACCVHFINKTRPVLDQFHDSSKSDFFFSSWLAQKCLRYYMLIIYIKYLKSWASVLIEKMSKRKYKKLCQSCMYEKVC